MQVFCVYVQVSTFISAVHLKQTQSGSSTSQSQSALSHLKYFSGHIMKGRIHWTNIASILVCPLIFESPNYINLEQLKVFKGIETVWSWPIPFHFLRDFRAGFLFRFICFGFRGLVKGSGEVKSSSLISNRGALCCFPFWIDKKSYIYSYILFVICAGQFRRRDCSSERAMFHSPCWLRLEIGSITEMAKRTIFYFRSIRNLERYLVNLASGFCFLWTSLRLSRNDTLHEVLWNGVWAC